MFVGAVPALARRRTARRADRADLADGLLTRDPRTARKLAAE